MLTKEVIIQKLEQNKVKIRSFGVSKLILFGSYARDEQKNKSDIDFLVEFEKGRGLFDDSVRLLHFLEDSFNKKIDIGKAELLREEIKPSVLNGAKIELII